MGQGPGCWALRNPVGLHASQKELPEGLPAWGCRFLWAHPGSFRRVGSGREASPWGGDLGSLGGRGEEGERCRARV